MAKHVYLVADNIFSPLGDTTAVNFVSIRKGISGVQVHDRPDLSDVQLAASLFPKERQILSSNVNYTKFEQLLIASVQQALSGTGIDPKSSTTGLIISTTKGNISLLETNDNTAELQQRISLNTSAKLVADYFGFGTQPIIISNACISGVMAIITAARLIKSGVYQSVVVTGADVVSKFVVSGFQSFQALSSERCKPFDASRNGLNLGEGAATVILSGDEKYAGYIRITGGAVSDDANHISGPSRTGEELEFAIQQAMNEAELASCDIDTISAHGTATPYNDDMEAKAITNAGLQHVPTVGVKAFYGHTLGAAGLIESILAAESMRHSLITATLGFEETGTSPISINTTNKTAEIKHALKTASGFGGCNAALILSK
ncbi:beta-ketoacyl-[acyl-carrier-protein] synthase family protein [Mucilaginibacter ginkgonis]|uniref:Beta-ketoacyl synthase n=1 Tax=Mucilaginibacter ginkgonis TaxID=2682091 RepID=A0A6I4HXC6_9SPHI|nr:beta-ketoacyl synthase N-terminal-like domain-containing protein [Mucilaginibacter ginkgonis]QQL49326.1 beta-ketoacyl synthase [Mucilaginibacter ginkgonis]